MANDKKGKQAILKVVFAELLQGRRNLSIRSIAGKAGVSVGLIYYHFDGLDAIYRDLHLLYIEHVAAILAPWKDELDPLSYEMLHHLLHLELNSMHEKVARLFIDCLDDYFVHIRKAVDSLYRFFGVSLEQRDLSFEARLFEAMIIGVHKMAMDHPEMGRQERTLLLQRGFQRLFRFDGPGLQRPGCKCHDDEQPDHERLDDERLASSMEQAAGIVTSIMEDTAISRWFFPAEGTADQG